MISTYSSKKIQMTIYVIEPTENKVKITINNLLKNCSESRYLYGPIFKNLRTGPWDASQINSACLELLHKEYTKHVGY